MSGERRSREERVREPERRNLSSFLPLIRIIFTFSLAAHGSEERRAIARGLRVACSMRSDRGDSAKRCEQKKTTRGWGRVCFSLSSLAPHSTIRTPGTGFLRSSKKHLLYMPPSVNDLELEKLVSRSPVSFSFCNKEKRRRLHAG